MYPMFFVLVTLAQKGNRTIVSDLPTMYIIHQIAYKVKQVQYLENRHQSICTCLKLIVYCLTIAG